MADIKFEKETFGLFAAGLVIGKYGKEILESETAKNLFVRGTVLGLKAKDAIAKGKEIVTEQAQDIYAEAKFVKEAEELDMELAESEEEIYEDCSDIDEFTEELAD